MLVVVFIHNITLEGKIMNYYITYHIDVEALHQDRLIELLNSYRLEILTKYKQLTDVYYSIEDGVLF